MSFERLTFPSDSALAAAVATAWLQELKSRPDPSAPYSVALSGGRIAKTFFGELARQTQAPGGAGVAQFSGMNFYWADERCVPPDDPESNYAIAMNLLFKPLGIAAAQIHRLKAELPEPFALREALSDVASGTPGGGAGPVLDMVFLGMGEDGHVASLFPGEPEEVMADPAVYRAVTAVKPPPRRLTLGYGTIAAAREVWVMVSGAGKEKALGMSVADGGNTPLARVLRLRERTKIWSDVEPV